MMFLSGSRRNGARDRLVKIAFHVIAATGLLFFNPLSFAQDAASYQGPDRQQRLIEAAKKEGELQLYTSTPADEIAILISAFEKKYGIKVKLWRSGSDMVVQRLVNEGHAHRFEADVVEADGTNLEALHREKTLQEVRSPYLADLIPQAIPPHREWVAARVNIFTLAYNTKLVSQSELPKTWSDLLNPIWKNRLGIEAADSDWFAGVVGELGEAKGLKLFHDIVAANGISVRKGHTLLANLVVSGEVPLALTVHNFKAEQFKRQGAPINWFVIAPAIAQLNGIAVVRNAPHPNAAVLFYDFMLSDAQPILAQHDYMTTSKKYPTALNKLPLKFMDHKVVLDETDKWNKLYQDIFINQAR
ncbi:MAG TPA: extracellular solute-binding protein [Herbaspirillum sp.]|jgi:iron(III) transport system substrate-binding protein